MEYILLLTIPLAFIGFNRLINNIYLYRTYDNNGKFLIIWTFGVIIVSMILSVITNNYLLLTFSYLLLIGMGIKEFIKPKGRLIYDT